MKKISTALPLAVMAVLIGISPQYAFAHGHTSFEINEKVYSFVVGSLNEPIAVDDKTGVDLRVTSMTHAEHEHAEAMGTTPASKPVTGLETTLKVELQAGDKKKVLDFSPAYKDPGAYRAYFTPTIQTTYGYRIFGTIEGTPFDYTFTCNPAGHPRSEDDKTEVEVSAGVKRIEQGGAFGCPVAKADLGFPEASMTTYDLKNAVSEAKDQADSSGTKGMVGIVVGVLGLAAGVGAWMRKKQ